jgi:2-polyprenyl-6-methoxyphenol hydroxylase-like FAD-dependent oxidoreductase
VARTDGRTPTSAVVVGASFAGLFAAAGGAAAGLDVVVCERDDLTDETAPRRGVPQGGQGHVLLHRGLVTAESLLPGLADELRDAGAVEFDSGAMPFRGDLGWLPPGTGYPILSISRVRLEQVVRTRSSARTRVRLETDVRVAGLAPVAGGWQVIDERGTRREATWVVDASGRGSRLPHWLRRLGVAVAEPQTVDARLGYAARTYAGTLPLGTAVRLLATRASPTGGMALPLEGGRWLIGAEGYGADRPERGEADFAAFLGALPDPALADMVATLEPVDEVHVYRQTANRRLGYGDDRSWPPGLLVVGDALCAFNPVYGQGITVAALQGAVLRDALGGRGARDPRRSRRVQQRLARPAAMAWQTSTSEDRQILGQTTRADLLLARWVDRVIRLAMAGDPVCGRALNDVYHLMRPASSLLGAPVVAAVARGWRTRAAAQPPRPAVLAGLGTDRG